MTMYRPTTLYACMRCQHAEPLGPRRTRRGPYPFRVNAVLAPQVRFEAVGARCGVLLIDAACWFVGGRPVAYVEQQVEP